MQVNPGVSLGPYEILAPLGAGGMGEVHRARDSRLDREVAIKVLPEALARDKERILRFEREAKVLASLNHPHIAAIYGFEESEGKRFLVMELVEGETLAERLHRGPIPVREALELATGIAVAVDAAHEKGIIHRDLKPANVKVTPDGAVKVLDFGLAKAMTGDTTGTDIANSPTITLEHTQPGVVLGTAAYMSPEQARGKPLDKRTDIWSFGCVLYECLTGHAPFRGHTATDLIARILERDPDWSKLPPGTPPLTQWLLRGCLAKDRKQRFHDIGDIRIGLAESLLDRAGEAAGDTRTGRFPGSHKLVWALSLVVVLALGVGGSYLIRPTRIEPKPAKDVVRFSLSLPQGTHVAGWASPVVAFSSDGRIVAFVGMTEGKRRLYIQHLDRNDAILVEGDEAVEGPFFSPDSQWLGYADGPSKLKKVSVDGTTRQTICELGDYFGASWVEDGTVYYSQGLGLWRVSEHGGTPSLVFADGDREIRWPHILPGGEYALFVSGGEGKAVHLSTGTIERLGLKANHVYYSHSGHLVYETYDGTVEAVPFDAGTRRVQRTGVTVLADVAVSGNDASASALSESGALVYVPGYLRGSGRELRKIVRLGRDGKVLDVLAGPTTLATGFSLSPDSRHLALAMWDGSLWVYDLQRNTRLKLPTGETREIGHPLWAPDGERIVFSASYEYDLFIQYADGRRLPELLLDWPNEQHPESWTADGRALIFRSWAPQYGSYLLPMDGGDPRILIPGVGVGQISPDGQWVAFVSDESGRSEVYLQAYPDPGRKFPVSIDGGNQPIWSRDGSEIFFLDVSRSRMMAVSVQTEPELRLSSPQTLFEVDNMSYLHLDSDGEDFLVMMREPDSGIQTQLNIVLNWTEELSRFLPTDTNR